MVNTKRKNASVNAGRTRPCCMPTYLMDDDELSDLEEGGATQEPVLSDEEGSESKALKTKARKATNQRRYYLK